MSPQIKILVGIIFTVLTCVPLAAVAINDMGHDIGAVAQTQQTSMDKRAADIAGRQTEVGADLFSTYCAPCHGVRGQGTPGLAPAIDRKDLLDGRREKAVGWAGGVEGFLMDTISAGRPVQSRPDLYSAHMPTWSQQYAGPLRPDQVDALVAFVSNWQNTAPEVDAWPPPGTPQPTPTAGSSPTPAPIKAGVDQTCQNIPAQYAGQKSPFPLTDSAALAAGKQTYDTECAACHGPQGKGDGPGAGALNPKPVNFADKAFMQTIPIDCHFYRVNEGVAQTGMPPWKSLGADTIWKVLIYERSFSGAQ
jgi:mono/diheme cytochrome c family protein